MKPVDNDTLMELESLIKPSVTAIRAYLTYQGDNASYRDKAKIAVGLVSSFARVRASETNRMQVELIGERMSRPEIDVATQPRQLTRAK